MGSEVTNMPSLTPVIWELSVLGVFDPGIPNRERLIIRPTEAVNLGDYAVGTGIIHDQDPNLVYPIRDSILWLPGFQIEPPAWIFVYTGEGNFKETTVGERKDRALVVHWSRERTIFNHREIVPVLYKLSGMLIGPCPQKPPLPKAPQLPPPPKDLFAGLPLPKEEPSPSPLSFLEGLFPPPKK